jgi:hypothetical protein
VRAAARASRSRRRCSVDACSVSCNSFRTALGQDVPALVSDSLPVGKGTGYYRVTGTWVVANHQHTDTV